MLAVDFAGMLAWHAPLGPIQGNHGTAGSPLLYRDRVIIFQDHIAAEGGFVAAFDAKTGERRWWKPRAERVGHGTPIAVRAGARDEIIVSSMRAVYAYDPPNRAHRMLQPIPLGGQHVQQLAAARHQRVQLLDHSVWEPARRRAHSVGTEREEVRIQVIGLGQLAGCLREVADLGRIRDHRRQHQPAPTPPPPLARTPSRHQHD